VTCRPAMAPGNLLRSVCALEAGWHLGSLADVGAEEVRCGRRSRVGSERGQHHSLSTSARQRGASENDERRRKKGVVHPQDEALGRSRGGLTSKIHLACDGKGRPLSIVVTAGQGHESTQLAPLLEAIEVPRPGAS